MPPIQSDSEKTTRDKKILLKVDNIIEDMDEDDRDIAGFNDIENLIKREVQNYKDKDQDLVRPYIYKKYGIR